MAGLCGRVLVAAYVGFECANVHRPSFLFNNKSCSSVQLPFIISLYLFLISYVLLIVKVPFLDTSIMSGVVHHLVSRGIDATRQGWTSQSVDEPEVTVFRMPTWGFVTLWLTALLWVGAMFAVSLIQRLYSATQADSKNRSATPMEPL